jgi:hypothetical protein
MRATFITQSALSIHTSKINFYFTTKKKRMDILHSTDRNEVVKFLKEKGVYVGDIIEFIKFGGTLYDFFWSSHSGFHVMRHINMRHINMELPFPSNATSHTGYLVLSNYKHCLPEGFTHCGNDLFLLDYNHPLPEGL